MTEAIVVMVVFGLLCFWKRKPEGSLDNKLWNQVFKDHERNGKIEFIEK